MIPKELEKPIDEIKTASTRILIICLILAIVAMATVIVYQAQGNDRHFKRENEILREESLINKAEIMRLNKYIIDKQEEDNRFYKSREIVLDSFINITKHLNNKLIK